MSTSGATDVNQGEQARAHGTEQIWIDRPPNDDDDDDDDDNDQNAGGRVRISVERCPAVRALLVQHLNNWEGNFQMAVDQGQPVAQPEPPRRRARRSLD